MLFRRWKAKRNDSTVKPPGVVVNHISARTGKYIGSPSIAVLPNGDYIAAHDYFRKNKLGISPQNELLVFGSCDKGATWQKRAELKGFWHNLFTYGDQGALYLMGLTKEYGHVIIRRSTDSGFTWTEPVDRSTGLLLNDLEYHTAPVPILVHNNRIWRAMEETENGRKEWAKRFGAFVMSAPVDSDLLDANNWTTGNRMAPDEAWLGGDFGGWLEGNAVLAPDRNIVNILRVDTPGLPEKAAIITMNPESGQAAFDPDTGFVDFPGGAKKFTIRFDTQSGFYWTLVNPIKPEHEGMEPIAVRNTLALSRSADLRTWVIRALLLEHPDPHLHGFQYVDWLFDGDDIIAVVRTAFDDPVFGANSAHNANYLTFHRFVDFRNL